MDEETAYIIMDIIIMIIIIVNTWLIYRNNKKMSKIDERLKNLKAMVNITKEE